VHTFWQVAERPPGLGTFLVKSRHSPYFTAHSIPLEFRIHSPPLLTAITT
jgi:hypothetical protein